MPEGKHLYEFGAFRLDPAERSLLRDGQAVPLTPKAFELLVLLVENRGHLLKKNELIERVWPNTFVEEANLAQNISALRKALDDRNGGAQYIETVPKGGYRFTDAVVDNIQAGGAGSHAVEPLPPRFIYRVTHRRALAFLAATSVAVILMLAFQRGVFHLQPSGTANAPRIQSVAVLPLENLSGDSSQDYFADGMTDELITKLGQIRSLRVISRTSVMQYKGTRKPLPQIASELHVEAILEGAVLRSGDQVRITAQLVQATEEKHLWAQSYEGNVRDVLGLQDEIARAVAKQIRSTLSPREEVRAGVERPAQPEAYESYLRGEYFLNRFTADSINKAADYFQQAIEKDPNYAPAFVKLAGCYQILANMNVIPKKAAYAKANPLVARALELDPQFAAAHAVQGWRLLFYELDFAAAAPEFKRAVELNPNGVEGHEGMGSYYATIGQMQESVQELQRARELDPLASIVNSDLCQKLFFARRYDDALAQCKANIELDPNAPRTFWFVGDVYTAKGMDSEAVASYLQALQLAGAPPSMIAAAKTGTADSGLRGFWKSLVQFVPENVANRNLEPYDAAGVYAHAGDNDKALFWLEKAVEARCYGITYLGVNPLFDPLHSDPRFVSLLNRIGLPRGNVGKALSMHSVLANPG